MLERPKLAILSGDVLVSQDDKSTVTRPAPGAHAAAIARLMHHIAQGDFESAGAALCDDVRYDIAASQVAFPVRSAAGRDAVLDAMRQNFAAVQSQSHELLRFVEDGDSAMMMVRESGTTSDGQRYRGYAAFVLEFRDGRLASLFEITTSA